MVIFHSYVKLPESIPTNNSRYTNFWDRHFINQNSPVFPKHGAMGPTEIPSIDGWGYAREATMALLQAPTPAPEQAKAGVFKSAELYSCNTFGLRTNQHLHTCSTYRWPCHQNFGAADTSLSAAFHVTATFTGRTSRLWVFAHGSSAEGWVWQSILSDVIKLWIRLAWFHVLTRVVECTLCRTIFVSMCIYSCPSMLYCM